MVEKHKVVGSSNSFGFKNLTLQNGEMKAAPLGITEFNFTSPQNHPFTDMSVLKHGCKLMSLMQKAFCPASSANQMQINFKKLDMSASWFKEHIFHLQSPCKIQHDHLGIHKAYQPIEFGILLTFSF